MGNRTYPMDNVPGDTYETIQFRNFDQIHIHPLWNTTSITDGFDIALLIADGNETINIDIDQMPILAEQLYIDEPCCSDDESLEIIGYGRNATDGFGTYSLEYGEVQYMEKIDCYLTLLELLGHEIDFNDNVFRYHLQNEFEEDGTLFTWFCVNDDLTGICNGDSGGPIFRMTRGVPEITGITSFKFKECGNGYPSGFTSIAHFSVWIWQTIDYAVDGLTWSPTIDPTPPTTAMPSAHPITTLSPTTAEPTEYLPTKEWSSTDIPAMYPTNNGYVLDKFSLIIAMIMVILIL